MDVRYDILELTRFLTELSVIDYYFVGQRQSTVSLAALFNAMEAIPGVSDSAIDDLSRELSRLPDLNPNQEDVLDSRNRLVWTISDFFCRVTEPVLRPIRRFLPNLGGVDLSPLVLILLLQALRILLGEIYVGVMTSGFG